jgi:enoyl-CoA hydratase/carnithine racemase
MNVEAETVEEHIRILTLNRPERLNALSMVMVAELDAAVERAASDGMRAIVLTGAGDRAFSAGNDIHEFTTLSVHELAATEIERKRSTWSWANSPVPTIAAINGICYGGGAILAVSADLRVGGPQMKFKVAAASFGNPNLTWNLPALIGLSHARDILMTSRVVSGEEAYRMGLLNRYADDGDVRAAAIDLARQIAANPPGGPQSVKRLLNRGVGDTMESSYDREFDLYIRNVLAADATELFAGFLGKRSDGNGDGEGDRDKNKAKVKEDT